MKRNSKNPIGAPVDADQSGSQEMPAIKELRQPPAFAIIYNETDSFIRIKSQVSGISDLIIAPFGSRTVNRGLNRDYSLSRWEQQKLISIAYVDAPGPLDQRRHSQRHTLF